MKKCYWQEFIYFRPTATAVNKTALISRHQRLEVVVHGHGGKTDCFVFYWLSFRAICELNESTFQRIGSSRSKKVCSTAARGTRVIALPCFALESRRYIFLVFLRLIEWWPWAVAQWPRGAEWARISARERVMENYRRLVWHDANRSRRLTSDNG